MTAEVHSLAGKYGYKFLNVPPGPVSIALGGGGAHCLDTPYAFIDQPAAACEADQRILGIAISPWLVDTDANTLAYSYAKRTSHFGLAMRNLDYGEVENRDETGFLIGYYNPVDITLLANYAYRMGPSTWIGTNFGVLYQKLDTATSLGAYADVGVSMLPPIKDCKLSASIRNIGNATKTDVEKTLFPTTIQADLTKDFHLQGQTVTLGLNCKKGMDENLKGTIYSQIEIFNMLKLRGAYKLGYAAEDISAGFGIAYHRFSIDYGYAAFDNGLNDVQSFGVSYQF